MSPQHFWLVKRGGMYLTHERVFRSGHGAAWRFCCAGDAAAVAATSTHGAVAVRVRRRLPEASPTVVEKALIAAISQIAQYACRNGESGQRTWPDLENLPHLRSWTCVGETYAKQVMATLFAAGLQATPRQGKEP